MIIIIVIYLSTTVCSKYIKKIQLDYNNIDTLDLIVFMTSHFVTDVTRMYFVTLEVMKILLLVMACSVYSQKCVSPTPKCDCFEMTGKKIINCRYKNLTEVPNFIDTHVIYDEIRFTSFEDTGTCRANAGCNNIKRLNAHAFANLKVRVIDLRNNPIAHVDVNAFTTSVPTLQSLLMEGNGLNAVPYQSLANLDVYLQSLHLENYGSTALQNPVVFPFPYLETLSLVNWKQLTSISEDIFSVMQNVTEFQLEKMPSLSSLPVNAILKFRKLTSISIIETGITNILGDTFATLPSLKEVNVRNNIHLKSIDRNAFLGVTDTIAYLDMSSNSLDNADFLGGALWSDLYQLNIGYNFDLRKLPTGIFSNTPSLRYLTGQDISLTRIDKEMFVGLSKLHTLDLAFNEINFVSTGAFSNTPLLADLLLHDQNSPNKMLYFQNNSFFGIEASLEVLYMMNNRFNLAQFWDDLTRLKNLKALDLSNTGINVLPDNAFKGNKELNSLTLADNNITSIKQDTFNGPRLFLQTVNLRGNAIQTIDECAVNGFPILPTFILYGNPLVCDCELVWLYDWYSSQNNVEHHTMEIGMCASPNSFAHKFFNEFSRNEMCPGNQPAKMCPDLSSENTLSPSSSSLSSSVATTSSTITTSSHTREPLPPFELSIRNVTFNTIEITWTIKDLTSISEIKLELKSIIGVTYRVLYIGKDQKNFTFYQLLPDANYVICLVLKFDQVFREGDSKCLHAKTLETTSNPDSVIG